jgi:hypothetical protein
VFAEATDRGAKAVKAGLLVVLVAGLKPGAGLTADCGGRAGSEEGGAEPGGGGYDMMNVWSGRNYWFQSRTRCLEEADIAPSFTGRWIQARGSGDDSGAVVRSADEYLPSCGVWVVSVYQESVDGRSLG